jgi:hypothetical protein
MNFMRISRLGWLSVRKVQEASLFKKEVRSPSQDLFQRDFSRRGMPIYLDGRELRVKPKIIVM